MIIAQMAGGGLGGTVQVALSSHCTASSNIK
jgi:hypothetical protein